jgi:POT family proton-dependent oligopeptide transporter
MPPGIPYIVGNEVAERFSFYGMRTILIIFMTGYLRGQDGKLATMSDAEASSYYHLFEAAAYMFSIFGGILADAFLGKYLTIIVLSLVYCLGHVALAVDETRLGLFVGLSLIAVGAGGIKPCVSAHVGDQFGSQNQHLFSRVFGWFYLAINVGAFASSLLTPIYLDYYGPAVAFAVPGVLMFAATWYFWRGRHRFVHIPAGGTAALREVLNPEGRRSLFNLIPLYTFLVVFWSLYDQNGSRWVLQAKWTSTGWGLRGYRRRSRRSIPF